MFVNIYWASFLMKSSHIESSTACDLIAEHQLWVKKYEIYLEGRNREEKLEIGEETKFSLIDENKFLNNGFFKILSNNSFVQCFNNYSKDICKIRCSYTRYYKVSIYNICLMYSVHTHRLILAIHVLCQVYEFSAIEFDRHYVFSISNLFNDSFASDHLLHC